MKNIFLTFALMLSISTYAQIDPRNSVYNADGPYDIEVDSSYSTNPKFMIYKPVNTNSKTPVLIFQPGANGFFQTAITVHSYDLYTKHLASWGYVVIVLDITGGGFPTANNFSFAVNWVYTNARDNQHWMSNVADTTKIIVGGHSNGGVHASSYVAANPTKITGVVYFASYPSSFPPTNLSTFTGKVLDLAGSEDDASTPAECKDGYDTYTSASCKTFVVVEGLHHGGFGDYINTAQPVGSIGRDSATGTVRHLLVSFLESEFKNNLQANDDFFNTSFRPNNYNTFETTCTYTSVKEIKNEKSYVVYNNEISNPEKLTIEIYLMDGKKVLVSNDFKIDLTDYRKQILVIKCAKNNEIIDFMKYWVD